MYDDALPLSPNLRAAHDAGLATICQPGPSWTGAERKAMVESARAATSCTYCTERKSALSPSHVSGEHQDPTGLPAGVVDAVHRIRTDPGRLTRHWFDQITAEIDQAAYVELVSVVCTSVIIDTLHAALDQPLPSLPEAGASQPTRAATGDVVDDGAWLPITRAPRDMADTGLPAVPNILRAMGLVPDAVALFFTTFQPHYALKDIQLSISQAQAELVASRVSAWNECFY